MQAYRGDHVARRGNRTDQYLAVASFYGAKLAEDLLNPALPEFVLEVAARRAAHYALTGMRMREKARRSMPGDTPASLPGVPVLLDGLPGCP